MTRLTVMALVWAGWMWAQTATTETAVKPIGRGRVASILEPVVDAAGSRFRTAGQERWMAQVELKSGAGAALMSGQMVMEWPGRLSLNAGGKTLTFVAGTAAPSGLDEPTFQLAEILLEDSLDGFLAAHLSPDAGFRVIGSGYPDPWRPGSGVDAVSLRMPGRASGGKAVVARQYWFDRQTRALVRVIHGESGIEVAWDEWKEFQGNQFATSLTVTENKAVKYTLRITPAALGAKQNDGLFGAR